ncbi:isochorismatase family protein [Roseiterribacter gracilis]|uniref:Uncharacterized protein n=1 Tax=Roseiterribacter gracilis TaxID=2812848 RepID=A0A8S8XH54_9PROT|nr:hypothetical protein TMPK1_34560 [Rhodospirillales bacterium TMPK1]
MKVLRNTALLVIDMQVGFDDPAWGRRNNPQAEANVARLIAAWRAAQAPVIHVHHDSPRPTGRLRPGTPGNVVKPEAQPLPNEPVYRKTVNSAFIGTSLEKDLRAKGVRAVALVGLTTNHCISTTARMAGNLGFETIVVADATATFERANLDGHVRSAEEVHNAALSDLSDEFATIVGTNLLLATAEDASHAPVRAQFLGAVAACVLALLPTTSRAQFVDSAFAAPVVKLDPTLAVDPSVKPGDDFYGYANNAWMRATKLPDGAAKIDTTSLLRAESARRAQSLVEEIVAATNDPDRPASAATARKLADYYATRLDTDAIEAAGFAPIANDLAAIAAINDRTALATWLGRTTRLDDGGNVQTESLWGVWIHQGFHQPNRYAVHLVQGGLGLPDRDFYLDAGKAARREQYRTYVANVLRAAGFDQADLRAVRVLDLETAIAGTHASRADTDDVVKTDNNWQMADFTTNAPGVDWGAYFTAAGIHRDTAFVVWQPQAVIGSAKLVATQPLDAWKDYLAFHLVAHAADVLPKAVGDARRAFDGTPAPDRKQQALAATQAVFADAIGCMYVRRYFPPQAKEAATQMANNLRSVFRTHLPHVKWMSPATRDIALAKLDSLQLGLGFPETWTDYTGLAITRGDAFGNQQRADAFAYKRELAKLNGPVDLNEWPNSLHPQNAGAVLQISPNTMQFGAGILQPPFFDPTGDAASNYGSAGAGMAHEISHTFDEVTNQYDAQGRLGLWWTKDDAARFAAMNAPLAAQLDSACPSPGLCTKGKQVVAESSADLVGLAVAYEAYHLSLRGKPDVTKNGLTGDQRFFIAFAQRWRRIQTDASLKAQIETDTHAPPDARANLVRNFEPWVKAFGVKPGDRLWVEPEKRWRGW